MVNDSIRKQYFPKTICAKSAQRISRSWAELVKVAKERRYCKMLSKYGSTSLRQLPLQYVQPLASFLQRASFCLKAFTKALSLEAMVRHHHVMVRHHHWLSLIEVDEMVTLFVHCKVWHWSAYHTVSSSIFSLSSLPKRNFQNMGLEAWTADVNTHDACITQWHVKTCWIYTCQLLQ